MTESLDKWNYFHCLWSGKFLQRKYLLWAGKCTHFWTLYLLIVIGALSFQHNWKTNRSTICLFPGVHLYAGCVVACSSFSSPSYGNVSSYSTSRPSVPSWENNSISWGDKTHLTGCKTLNNETTTTNLKQMWSNSRSHLILPYEGSLLLEGLLSNQDELTSFL